MVFSLQASCIGASHFPQPMASSSVSVFPQTTHSAVGPAGCTGVADAVAGERLERLIATVRDVARQKNGALVGTTWEVLVEKGARRGGLLQTRTRTNKVALLEGPEEWIGRYMDVRFTGTTGATFTAVPTRTVRELAVVG